MSDGIRAHLPVAHPFVAPPELRTWGQLQREASSCTRCPLHESRTHVVFADGDPSANLMFVGEAPGRHEDLRGKPFAGAAGNLLANLLAENGVRREEVYLTHLVKCRPADRRSPQTEEVETCNDYLREQVAHVAPQVVVALGEHVTQTLLRRKVPVAKVAGYPLDVHGITVIPTFDPGAALRGDPQAMSALRRDIRAAKAVLDRRLAQQPADDGDAPQP